MVKTPGFESGLDSDIVYLCEPRQRSLPRDHVIPHLDSVVNACLFLILFFFFHVTGFFSGIIISRSLDLCYLKLGPHISGTWTC